MGNKPASSQSPVTYRGKPRVKRIGNGVLPRDLARVVGDYLSDNSSAYAETALFGVQSITLRLSQDVKSQLGSCWALGFLTPEHRWKPKEARVDMEFSIDDLRGDPARFFDEDLSCCPLVIDVLVVQLSMASYISSNALDGLRKAITGLQEQLKSVNHVVVSITEYASCCFSFKDAIDAETKECQPINRPKALFEIVDDLSACWKKSWLTATELFAFYFENEVKPASETYLAKFVLVLNHPPHLAILEKQTFNAVSNKLMWACSMESEADFRSIPQSTPQLWSAIYCDVPTFRVGDPRRRYGQYWRPTFCSETSSIVERVHLHDGFLGGKIEFFQPKASLVQAGLHSALIELSLFGDSFSLHLTQLNTGYFPNLTILTLVDVKITGHLDSYSVPHLKELKIEPKSFTSEKLSYLGPLLSKHRQSIIHAGCPWQLVAARQQGGWSLASYDEPITNPQYDVKDDSPYPLPLIRHLLLVMENQEHIDQWQTQLNGLRSKEATAEDHNDRLLVWAPECVQNITVLGTAEQKIRFNLDKSALMKMPVLTSLHCLNVSLALDGSLFPHLQSFEENSCDMKLSGAFPHLETLTFFGGCVKARWQVNAPLLQSVRCEELVTYSNLSFQPQLLPNLSSLVLNPRYNESRYYPEVIVDKDGVGFSHLRYAGLSGCVSNYSFFNRFLVESVPDLELDMDAKRLPEFWLDTAWLCEKFYVFVYVRRSEEVPPPPTVVLPPLPRVKKLTVSEDEICHALLDREMPNLTECTVPSPRLLGPNLKCPTLQRIRFKENLSESDKEKCLDQATYLAIGARPKEVIFAFHREFHTMAWDVALAENEIPPLNVPLEEGGLSSSSSSSVTLLNHPS